MNYKKKIEKLQREKNHYEYLSCHWKQCAERVVDSLLKCESHRTYLFIISCSSIVCNIIALFAICR